MNTPVRGFLQENSVDKHKGAMAFDINNQALSDEIARASEAVQSQKSPCIIIWASDASPMLRICYGNAHWVDILRMLANATVQITDDVADLVSKKGL